MGAIGRAWGKRRQMNTTTTTTKTTKTAKTTMHPRSLTESSGSDEEDDEEEGDDGRSYIVFWSCLATLFQLVRCTGCGMIANTVRRRVCSTMLRVIILCTVCRHETKWESQTREPGGAPAGNIMLSTAIMTAGALPSKVLRVLRYMSVAVHSTRTYFRHQRELVMPAVQRVWLEQQQWLLASLQAEDRPLVFCGDCGVIPSDRRRRHQNNYIYPR